MPEFLRHILCLLFQPVQFVSGLLDLTLQGIIFLLRYFTLGKLLISDLALLFQFLELGFRLTDFLLDRVVLCFPSIVVVFGFSSLFACFFQRFEFVTGR
ncbi:MAG: hypothetical protein BWZ04_02736 [Firmicutes bacterium ADurb.BinA205]|nr:MAG: hypothetical protein BWZ04_02736 [Firmicutes bacterium ADurb.BinA205]